MTTSNSMAPWPLSPADMPAEFFEALSRARERYLSSGVVDDGVRPFVAESWARCVALGIHPSNLGAQPVDEEHAHRVQARHQDLLAAAESVLSEVTAMVEHPHLLALANEEATIVRLLGDPVSLGTAGKTANLFEGASWAESHIGCNGVGTALQCGAPVVLVGAEHFQEAYVNWTCIGIPLRGAAGDVVGILDFSVPNEHTNAHTWGWMLTLARMIETRLKANAPIAVPPPDQPFNALRGILEMIGRHMGTAESSDVELGNLERQVNEAESQFLSAIAVLRHRTRQLESVKRDKDDSIAALAHELRGPLFAVISCIEMLKGNGHEQETVDWARNVLERQALQMRSLVDDLMDLARVERGTMELKLQDLELSEVVEQAAMTVQHDLKKRNVSLKTSIPFVRLRADRVRLVQIMTNLLGNAVRYNRNGGRISVIASVNSQNEAEIHIADTGIGIERDLLPHIFEPFVQGRGKKRGGLGLGLPLVHRLVELHGGSIRVQSEVGKGTEVVVWLPALVESVSPRKLRVQQEAAS